MPYLAEMQFKADMIAFSFLRMYILCILWSIMNILHWGPDIAELSEGTKEY